MKKRFMLVREKVSYETKQTTTSFISLPKKVPCFLCKFKSFAQICMKNF